MRQKNTNVIATNSGTRISTDHAMYPMKLGIAMPSFIGYMAWSVLILVPLFVAMTFVFF